jgi:hypothetical protein
VWVATGSTGGRVGPRVGFGEGLFVGTRVVGCRDGLGVGLRVVFGGLAPLTSINDTRYAVSTRPLTLAVTVWAPTFRFWHELYDCPPQSV